MWEIGTREVSLYQDDHGFWRSDNGRPPFRSLISLQQIIAEALGFGVNSRRVNDAYSQLIVEFANELQILLHTPIDDIAKALDGKSQRIPEGVSKVREGDIYIETGFDGQFGKVHVWSDTSEK